MRNSNESNISESAQTDFPFYKTKVSKKAAKASPFVKWAGGKSSLLSELLKRVPKKYRNYFEPFAGGGALFFNLNPEKSYISDENEELINTYRVVKKDLKRLIKNLEKFYYDSEFFYKIRSLDKKKGFAKLDKVKKAARFIFLNKTCFNGLYRVNGKGEFNVPFGRYTNPKILDVENLTACSKALKKTYLKRTSYKKILNQVKKGDFIYLDPPYMPLSKTSNFTSYTKSGFNFKEQEELSKFCKKLDKKGALFMLSNSSHPEIKRLYQDFIIEAVKAPRAINSKAAKRGSIEEIIVRNYI
jgi:DNA adenine methylase